jgi:hypothetical protein
VPRLAANAAASTPQGAAPSPDPSRKNASSAPTIMSPSLLLPFLVPVVETEAHSRGGNAAAELLLVFLLLIIFWGAFRITSKKRP